MPIANQRLACDRFRFVDIVKKLFGVQVGTFGPDLTEMLALCNFSLPGFQELRFRACGMQAPKVVTKLCSFLATSLQESYVLDSVVSQNGGTPI